jgi:hypothetical protein
VYDVRGQELVSFAAELSPGRLQISGDNNNISLKNAYTAMPSLVHNMYILMMKMILIVS